MSLLLSACPQGGYNPQTGTDALGSSSSETSPTSGAAGPCMGGGPDGVCEPGELYGAMGCPDCFCGNGSVDLVDPGLVAEACDDGTKNAQPGWYLDEKCELQSCTWSSYCGDGVVDANEQCDPMSDPKCRANCEGWWPYPGDGVCTANELAMMPPPPECGPVCGDGHITPPETCEPGLDPNKPCDGPDGKSPCGMGTCGDGSLNHPGEQCDDGNMNPGDGCSANCTVEPPPVCGDGNKAPSEECDDGLDPLCKGCQLPRRAFVTSSGYTPGIDFMGVAGAENICKTLAGNANLGSAKNTWLVWMSESDQVTAPANRVPRSNKSFMGNYMLPGAGNIIVAEGWADLTDGTLNNPLNRNESGIVPANLLRAWTNTTAWGTSAGPNDCSKWADSDGPLGVCGEVNLKTSLWSEGKLLYDCFNPYRLYCIEVSQCGDGVVQGDEECDDGNDIETDACLNTCRIAKCGDGVVREGVEACDDGNVSSSDDCSPTCKPTGCGDGIIQGGEECDDGNQANTDGCLNTCKKAGCGDGFTWDKREYCDDGNAIDTDACRNDCTLPGCGDGVVQEGVEECDDGNAVDTDACRNKCIAATCGDRVVWDGMEDCDDGNDKDDDACGNDCKNG